MDKIQVQPSSSMEVLDLLVGAGLNRVQAAKLLSGVTVPGQRPSMHGLHKDLRSSSPLVGGQNIPQTAAMPFKTMVMETLTRFGEKLKYLTARSRAVTPCNNSTQRDATKGQIQKRWGRRSIGRASRLHGVDRMDTDNLVHPLVQVSEGTTSMIKTAFKGPIPNTARLQTWKGYSFPTWRTQSAQSWTK